MACPFFKGGRSNPYRIAGKNVNLELVEFKPMATEWQTASCHGTVIGVDAGRQFFVMVFSNDATFFMGKLQIQSTKKSAAVTKNNGFFTTGMDCCMVPATAKAAVARTYNAKVACLVHIVVWSIGRGRYSNCDRLTEPAVCCPGCVC